MQMDLKHSSKNNKERQLMFDIWRTLRGNQNDGINIRNFKLFLLVIMKFNFAWMKSASNNNDIWLSLSHSNTLKAELKNYSNCQNNMTLDNLSSIKPEFNTSIRNLKRRDSAGGLANRMTSLKQRLDLNPSLQKFLEIKHDNSPARSNLSLANTR